MINTNLSLYISGLIDMVSVLSKNMKPSYINTECFEKEKFLEEFKKYYSIEENIELKESEKTINEKLKEWIKDDYLVNKLTYLIESQLGNNLKTLQPTEECNLKKLISRNNNNKTSAFDNAEDIIFAEYDKFVLVLSIGDND